MSPPFPKIEHPRCGVQNTACAICGSDLQFLDDYQPTMESGEILCHENVGEVVELGSDVSAARPDTPILAPGVISNLTVGW